MYTNSIIAATGALLSVVAAIPMADQHVRHHHHPAHKRDYVWVTHNEVVVETVGVTKTVWIEPGETPPVENPKPEVHHHTKAHNTQPAAYTPPAAPSSPAENTPQTYAAPPSSSKPVYVAPPAPTTPTSTYVAPPAPTTPTTTEAPAAYTPPAAPASSPAPASYGGSSGGGSGLSSGMGASGKSYSGDLTWYDVGMGACGWTNTANEAVVAISEAIFDSYSTGNPNTNPLCGKYVSITGKDGQQHKAKIVDRCPGCDQSSLDLSHDFFNTVTDNGDGRVKGMEWTMV